MPTTGQSNKIATARTDEHLIVIVSNYLPPRNGRDVDNNIVIRERRNLLILTE
jgi:hypothetical protein